jgi:antitoxin MazE
MKTRIITIGNSRGLRIPKPLLDSTGLSGDVEISAQGSCLVIRPLRVPRAGWAAAFRRMREQGDDELLNGAVGGQIGWDADDWEWG